jgi:uncharacterized protein
MTEKDKLIKQIGISRTDKLNIILISGNKILETNINEKILVKVKSEDKKISIKVNIPEKLKVKDPIHICFGAIEGKVVQNIYVDITLEKNSKAVFFSDCILTSNEKIEHSMNSKVKLAEGSEYLYLERHIHNEIGSVFLKPKTKAILGKKSIFKIDFELIKGRAGNVFFDYDIESGEESIVEMETRLKAYGKDSVVLKEKVDLKEKGAKALLKSRVGALDSSIIKIYNTISAKKEKTRGHIDCQEILMGKGNVQAYPSAEVLHPKAHVTHEASLGGLDNAKIETLMARGKSEKEAENILLEGMLSRKR